MRSIKIRTLQHITPTTYIPLRSIIQSFVVNYPKRSYPSGQ
jgi:hypothetical protein